MAPEDRILWPPEHHGSDLWNRPLLAAWQAWRDPGNCLSDVLHWLGLVTDESMVLVPALAFVPLPTQRWLAGPGLSLIYYLRFWFLYHFPDKCALLGF